jgi:hypothetical protein
VLGDARSEEFDMTSPPPSTPPSSATGPDWSPLIDHWAKITTSFVEDLSHMARTNSEKFREGSYDRDAWLADFSSLVRTLADNVVSTAELCTHLYPRP